VNEVRAIDFEDLQQGARHGHGQVRVPAPNRLLDLTEERLRSRPAAPHRERHRARRKEIRANGHERPVDNRRRFLIDAVLPQGETMAILPSAQQWR
jgi:hypothetical protein